MSYQVKYLDGDNETADFVSRAGEVEITYENGNIYTGTVDDRRLKHGKGKLEFALEESEEGGKCFYEGEFTDGKRTGVASMTFPDGTVYRGEFTEGFRHGQGSYTYPNQDIYSGSWENDERHGHGTYLFVESGCTLKGEWSRGSPVDGTFVHPDGTLFESGFTNGCHDSKTTISFPSGMTAVGEIYSKGDEHQWVRKSVVF